MEYVGKDIKDHSLYNFEEENNFTSTCNIHPNAFRNGLYGDYSFNFVECKNIGELAFDGVQAKEIKIESAGTIQPFAFKDAIIDTLVINSVEYINVNAFEGAKIKKLIINNIPEIYSNTFYDLEAEEFILSNVSEIYSLSFVQAKIDTFKLNNIKLIDKEAIHSSNFNKVILENIKSMESNFDSCECNELKIKRLRNLAYFDPSHFHLKKLVVFDKSDIFAECLKQYAETAIIVEDDKTLDDLIEQGKSISEINQILKEYEDYSK